MILDDGICTVFHASDMSRSGEAPCPSYTPFWASWYGLLSYETSPARPTEGRKELRVDNRIRIQQNREIKQDDVVALDHLQSFAEAVGKHLTVYRVTRAYHGTDSDDPTPITDLSLEVFVP